MDPVRVVLSLCGVVLVIIAAYYTTWYIGAKASGQSRGRLKNKNINIIDRFAISRDKSFYLVGIAGKVYVIGMTNQSMTLIDTLDAAAFPQAAAERSGAGIWPARAGGGRKGDITRKLAVFIAKKAGRPYEHLENPGGADFKDNMRAAGEKATSEQAANEQAERTETPEDKP